MYAPYSQFTGSWVFTEGGSGLVVVLVVSCAHEVTVSSVRKTLITDLRTIAIISRRGTRPSEHRVCIQLFSSPCNTQSFQPVGGDLLAPVSYLRLVDE